jgi:hypothetical protein
MILHASDLSSWNRCPQQWHLTREGHPGNQLSATAYGSVLHHALHVLERTGELTKAEDTFRHYWHPHHIEAITEPVQTWIKGQSYGRLAARGLETLRRYADLLRFDDSELLALEFEFVVPVYGTIDLDTGEPHLLAGTVDRLAARRYHQVPTVSVEDFKSGQRPVYLRHHVQGTAYAYASTDARFWQGWPEQHTDGFGYDRGAELHERFADAARRFWWIDVSSSVDWVDGGFRGDRDYARLALAIQAVADSIRAGIYPLALAGDVCQYCPQRAVCGGIGLDDAEGDPR